MRKKLISLCLALCLTAGGLWGCSAPAGTGETGASRAAKNAGAGRDENIPKGRYAESTISIPLEEGEIIADMVQTQDKILELLAPSYIEGFSLLGGEPFEPENQPVLAELLEEIRRTFPDKSIWCYSGYLFDKDMVPGGKIYTPFTDRMLSCIDVLVDGEFIQELKNLSLQFRGSSNQRILHLKDGKLIKEGL